ncbi:MAG: putative glycoside hydrolase [Marmoricola sp.]|nr:putative glycoside hydrolase [Marmoricola sp.]
MSFYSRPVAVLALMAFGVAGTVLGTGLAPSASASPTEPPKPPPPSAHSISPRLVGTDAFMPGQPYSGDFPDPTILRVKGVYYAYSTTIGSLNLPMVSSRYLHGWKARRTTGRGKNATHDAMPRAASWARTRKVDGHDFSTTWAPSVAHIKKTYVVAYATPPRKRPLGSMCISIATASSPIGPFVDRTRHALVCPGDQNAIDPQIFTTPDGSHWLLYKTEGVPGVVPARLWVRKLNAHATAFGATSAPWLLLETQDPWEGNTIENPAMILVGGRYYLFYSANNYTTDAYATGYAVCSTVRGPCTRAATNPLLASGGSVAGTGGAMPFRDPQGGLRLAYAAWTSGHTGYSTSRTCLKAPTGCNQRRMHVATLGIGAGGVLTVLSRG